MIVTFCGHSDLGSQTDAVYNWLYDITEKLINDSADIFYLGGYGQFDMLAASIIRKHCVMQSLKETNGL